jgi:hypothetical protein
MLNAREALQGGVRTGPKVEGRLNSGDDVIQGREISVMKAATPNQLPNPQLKTSYVRKTSGQMGSSLEQR